MTVATFSGLASGIDTASIVKQLVTLESAPITRMNQSKTDLNSVSAKFSNFKDLLTKLRDSAAGLQSRTDLLSTTAKSSDEKTVVATAAPGATTGDFEVSVSALASAQRNQSEAFSADESGIFTSGELTIQVGTGAALSIAVDDQTSLSSLATDINRSGAGVTASVLTSNGQSYLQISGNTTGAANAITFGGSAADTLGLDAHMVREAKDAQFEIDGLPMTSASNDVTTALPGVTLSLKGLTDGTSTTNVAMSRDNASIKTKLQGFVDAYNAIAKQINTEFAYKGTAQTGDTLSGDSGLRSIQSQLRGLVSTQVEIPGSGITSLSGIGIGTQADGTLAIDDTALTKALNDSPEAVAQLLTDDPGRSTGIFGQFQSALNDMVTGDTSVVTSRINSIATSVKSLDDQMSAMQTRIDAYQQRLTEQFAQMEATMSTLQSQGSQLTAMINGISTSK